MQKKVREKPILGWREWAMLPALGIERLKVKIDTGARTSALHAFRVTTFERAGETFARFYVHPTQHRRHPEILCEAPVVDERTVKSSNGENQLRYVVETSLKIGEYEWPIELTLTNRDEMGFRMLLGRQALRQRFVVDPGGSFRQSKLPAKPKLKTKQKRPKRLKPRAKSKELSL